MLFAATVLALLVTSLCEEEEQETLTITLLNGQLKGTSFTNRLNQNTNYAFFNIPFARPPVGALRFKVPQPPLPWEGVRDGTDEPDTCMQMNPIFRMADGLEDCLYLSVFTPAKPEDLQTTPKSVMVHIHAGAFHAGAGSVETYGPDFLLAEDVIVVLVNYRLGAFGFLSADTKELPGNAGLKDIVTALKWVNENIQIFGGDPGSVTVFGISSGGAAVGLLLLSPSAKGLFHRAISQSGVALSPWAFTKYTRSALERLGWVFDCNTTKSDEILQCLSEVDAEELTTYQYNAFTPIKSELKSNMIFLPSVEPPDAESAFLTSHPRKLLEEGQLNDVPYMLGTTSAETVVLARGLTEKMVPSQYRDPAIKHLNRDPSLLLPLDLEINDPVKLKQMGEKVKYFYFKNESISTDTLGSLVNVTTDVGFLLTVQETIRLYLNKSKSAVYQYYFTADTSYGKVKSLISTPLPGPSHGDDIGYLFISQGKKINTSDAGYPIMKKMCQLWANFAKHGDPTPESSDMGITWEPVKPDKMTYLEIGEELKMGENLEKERMDFWKNLFAEENLNSLK